MRRLAGALALITVAAGVSACDRDGAPGQAEARRACDAIDELTEVSGEPSRADVAELHDRMSTHADRAAKQSPTWKRLDRAVSDWIANSEMTFDQPDSAERNFRADAARAAIRDECETARA